MVYLSDRFCGAQKLTAHVALRFLLWVIEQRKASSWTSSNPIIVDKYDRDPSLVRQLRLRCIWVLLDSGLPTFREKVYRAHS